MICSAPRGCQGQTGLGLDSGGLQGAWFSPASCRNIESSSLLSEAKHVSVGEMPMVYQELKKLEMFQLKDFHSKSRSFSEFHQNFSDLF